MDLYRKCCGSAFFLLFGVASLLSVPLPVVGQNIIVSSPVTPKLSSPLRDLPQTTLKTHAELKSINPIRHQQLSPSEKKMENNIEIIQDMLAINGEYASNTPSPTLNFEGQSGDGLSPPDANGDVGPNHYVQMVNVHTAVYDKSGTLLGSWPNNALWSGFGGSCENYNDGDPIVLYDDMAQRWIITQFAIATAPEYECIAVSTTSDPTGSYYLYAFQMPAFPDYTKFGVWTDGYYFGTNTGFHNQYWAHVVDRNKMLAGQPATLQSFGSNANFLMPADADGPIPPPSGSPEYFYTFYKNDFPNHPEGGDRLAIYEFEVDWTTPANTTWTLVTEIPISTFNYTVCGLSVFDCISQPETTTKLDSLSDWPMVRLQYRNFGSYEVMVGNFTVDVDGTDKAAIRWFELRKSGANPWSLYQEGTYAPDSDNRFMGSIAMDGDGNIALGYSVSSSTTKPSIRYAIRSPGDPLGTLRTETSLFEGTGVQTSTNRWGDYSAMNVDPTDNCTFWMTNEYHDVDDPGFSWNTRIGTFKVPGCGNDFSWPIFLPAVLKKNN